MNTGYILSKQELFVWAGKLMDSFTVIGPVLHKKNETIFQKIETPQDLHLDYHFTMLAPRKFIYPSRQTLFDIDRKKNLLQSSRQDTRLPQLIFGIHPCDMHAISVLDRTFLGDFKDSYYSKLRETTFTVVINCVKACDRGFCSSMGTGPFLKLKGGYDIEISPISSDTFLLEFGSQRGLELIKGTGSFEKAKEGYLKKKKNVEKKALTTFKESIDTAGLPELLARNMHHPVYKETAETRCLGCTNCTMVCPTCYCYNVEEYTSFDLKTTRRARYWDSCQDLNFAKVHGANFRSSREARLRQFVTHKLCTWVEQYGCFGCVGCGRCMTWCPTGIDLTKMAKEIQEDFKLGKAE